MQSFFSDPGGVGREVALRSLRRDIVGLIGGPVKLHDTAFIDAPLADFFVTERDRDLYAIRWLDSQDFAAGLTRTLSAYVRLHDAGRNELARALGLPDDFSPATLVLVSDRMDDDWVRVVSTLRLPVMLLRAHSLVDGTRHSAGCLFEKCFFTRGISERPDTPLRPGSADKAPNVRAEEVSGIGAQNVAPSPTPSEPGVEPQSDDRPFHSQESSAAQHLRSIAEIGEDELPSEATDEEDPQGATAPDPGMVSEPPSPEAARPDVDSEPAGNHEPLPLGDGGFSPLPAATTETEASASEEEDDPFPLLSEEERATFRLLENVLESTR